MSEDTPDGRTQRSSRGPYSKKPDANSYMMSLSPEELALPGGALISLLFAKAKARKQTGSQMAAELGITYPYLIQLKNGTRQTEAISNELARSCAAYLEASPIMVMLASGKLKLSDLTFIPGQSIDEINHAYQLIMNDTEFGMCMPGELHEVSMDSKLFIIRLFEKAMNRKLIPDAVDLERIQKTLDSINSARSELAKAGGVQHNKVHTLNK